MNAQHSALTGEWYTPPRWIDATSRTLGGIFYDPCSSAAANTIVRAQHYHTAGNNALMLRWHTFARNGFVNPPGTCTRVDGLFSVCGNETRCSCALPREFLARSLIEAHHGMDIVYLAYSVNQLRQIARLKPPQEIGISIALPAERIPYIDPATMEPVKGTNCDSAFLCLSRDPDIQLGFDLEFRAQGCEVFCRA